MLISESYIRRIVSGLLNEEVQKNNVVNAIKRRHEVSFRYDSGDGDSRGKAERIVVQPVAYGTTKSGNLCFRGYQINGSSETYEKGKGKLPGWRLFLLDKVVANTWKDRNKVFNEPPLFNKEGDKTMSNVLLIANFSDTQKRYERGGLKKYNQNRREQNIAKDPYYYFRKNLAKHQMAPDFVMKNIEDTQKSRERRNAEWDEAEKELQQGNNQSIYDMSRQKDFGDNGYQETVGPVYKGNNNDTEDVTDIENNYEEALNNGPVYKNKNFDINNGRK